jgi:hypothetical protein
LCSLKTLKIVGPLSKIKPCTRTVPKIGKKTLESCDVQNIDNEVKAVNGAHMKEYKNKWQTTASKSQLGYAVWYE